MTANQIIQCIDSIFKSAYKRQRLTLGLLVISVFKSERLTVTQMGRYLPTDTVPKHAIKRADRWLSTRRFDDKQARGQFLRLIVGTRRRVLIAIDWTKLRRWPVLVAGIVHRGRAIPVLWSVADPAKLYKSQNAFEHGFFAWLRASLPPNVEAVVLLDRGFKRVDIVAHLKGLRFVIRTGGNVHVRSKEFKGRADQLITRRGMKRDLPSAVLRPCRPVHVRVVGTWAKKSKEPWILMTDLTDPALRIFALYAMRFRIEESFRDQKDWRYGLQAGHTLVRNPARLERMLLIASIVLFFAILIGAKARQDRLDKGFRANTVTHKPTHSDFALGIFYAMKFRCTRSVLLRIFYREGRDVFGG